MKDGKSDLWNIIDLLKRVIFASFATIIVIVTAFVLYLMKQSNDTITTIDANGVYNLVDSKGNVIATDLTADDINKLMEIINGKN